MNLEAPKRCSACKKSAKQINKTHKGWVMIMLPLPGIALYGCPGCNNVMINTNAMANIKTALEEQSKRIVKPGQRDLRLINNAKGVVQ